MVKLSEATEAVLEREFPGIWQAAIGARSANETNHTPIPHHYLVVLKRVDELSKVQS